MRYAPVAATLDANRRKESAMAAIEENGRSQGTLVDVDELDRALRAAVPSTTAVRVTCTDVRVRPDRLVLDLEVQVPLRPTGHHIVGFNADVTGT
jgi:hypothetical protein